jgi:phosphoenolpyruvate-protein kinase (PTS system EI component)
MAVLANVGSIEEAEAAARAGAEGIGLVRTELLFHGRPSPPSVGEQRLLYSAIRRAIAPRRSVFRTLDIGGDKPAAWHHAAAEPNPALGVRGIRLSLAMPELFEAQVRALAEAAEGGELALLLPMVSEPAEIVAARELIDRVLGGLDGPRPTLTLGAMVEVPSAAVMADALAPLVDFLSIGTNDLVQYTFAADRTNSSLASLASPFQPAIVRLIAGVVAAARAHGRQVAVCGEAATDPPMLWLLAGLGIVEVSVAPSSIAGVRATLADLDLERARALAEQALAATSPDEVRRLLAAPGTLAGER